MKRLFIISLIAASSLSFDPGIAQDVATYYAQLEFAPDPLSIEERAKMSPDELNNYYQKYENELNNLSVAQYRDDQNKQKSSIKISTVKLFNIGGRLTGLAAAAMASAAQGYANGMAQASINRPYSYQPISQSHYSMPQNINVSGPDGFHGYTINDYGMGTTFIHQNY